MANFNVRPSNSFTVRTAPGGVISSGGGGVETSASAPSSPVTGNLWYDSNNSVLKVYDGSNWDSLMGQDYDNDNRFEWKSDGAVGSGNIIEFKDSSNNSLFGVTHDRALLVNVLGSAPTAVKGGLYSDGDDLFFGVQ
tara:strand:- start:2255 stop:2665 length:411 start_codon:yes stop_codon:yes gene_type:complete